MDRLAIPRDALVVLCGPAGSGKSTFARRHFRPTAIVSSDRCRAMVGDDEANIAVSPLAFELFHLIIDLRLRQRRLTVADSTAVRREAREDLLRAGRRRDVPVVLIVFAVSLARAHANNARRRRQVKRAVIDEQWQRLAESLGTVAEEGFEDTYVLGDEEISTSTIEWTRPRASRVQRPVSG